MPITVGGGIRNVNDIKEILVNGADRVSINTAAVNDKKFIKESVKVFRILNNYNNNRKL